MGTGRPLTASPVPAANHTHPTWVNMVSVFSAITHAYSAELAGSVAGIAMLALNCVEPLGAVLEHHVKVCAQAKATTRIQLVIIAPGLSCLTLSLSRTPHSAGLNPLFGPPSAAL